jgi:cobalamin biosynthesis Mg chelatase CobN
MKKIRDKTLERLDLKITHAEAGMNRRESRQRRRNKTIIPGVFAILLFSVLFSGIAIVDAVPVGQEEVEAVVTSNSTVGQTTTASPSPSPTVTGATITTGSGSSSQTSSTTSASHGTVVTDSPLVRTSPSNSDLSSSILRNHSSITTLSALPSTYQLNYTNSTTTSSGPPVIQSPTSDNGNGPTQGTENSLVYFYFLILAAAIALAVLAWYLWRRRRKGKTTRDRRRALEALRQDLELGRLRRGFLGVVGRGGGSGTASNEELPAYVSQKFICLFTLFSSIFL